jgi:endonuclease/exonuclease/phosphatase family metal-dependent hydrolase
MSQFFSTVSWNIWFNGTLEHQRLTSLIANLHAQKADFICLQEVKPETFKTLIQNLQDYKYHYPDKISTTYGCVIFSKYPITDTWTIPFTNSKMERELLITQIQHPITDLIIATAHFESIFKKNTVNKTKLEQFNITQQALDDLACKNVILCADCNIMSQEEDFLFVDDSEVWKDAWQTKGNSSNEYTYDCENNIYLMLKNKKKYRSRLDRILYRIVDCELTEFKLLTGSDDMPEPSDHFGVLARFRLINV